uniref:Chitin-binding protein n=1 Tax=Babjeviella inositovora TaxID=45609 RepID=Q7Z8R6_9ASCO|nr:chitin-binding protein [Babjeviella inositovora]
MYLILLFFINTVISNHLYRSVNISLNSTSLSSFADSSSIELSSIEAFSSSYESSSTDSLSSVYESSSIDLSSSYEPFSTELSSSDYESSSIESISSYEPSSTELSSSDYESSSIESISSSYDPTQMLKLIYSLAHNISFSDYEPSSVELTSSYEASSTESSSFDYELSSIESTSSSYKTPSTESSLTELSSSDYESSSSYDPTQMLRLIYSLAYNISSSSNKSSSVINLSNNTKMYYNSSIETKTSSTPISRTSSLVLENSSISNINYKRFTSDIVKSTSTSPKPRIMPKLLALATTSKCTNADEVALTLNMNNIGSNNYALPNDVISAAQMFQSWLKGNSNRDSLKYQSGNIVGYLWVGNMVQNSGAADTIVANFIQNVGSDGIKDTKYVQYSTANDPAKGAGIVINTKGDLALVQKIVRTWSKGQSYDAGTYNWNNKVLCYLSYANRKLGGNDEEAGDCDYKKVVSGRPIADTCGVTSDALIQYNPGVDFTKLNVGQPICCSEGKPQPYTPKCKDSTELVINYNYGYVRGTKTDDTKNNAIAALNSFNSWVSSTGTRGSFKYQSGNTAAFMWIGSMVQNDGFKNNAIKAFTDEINLQGMPKVGFLEYMAGDPMKGFGIIIDVSGNLTNVQNAVKNWSMGKGYTIQDANKSINSQSICYLDYAKRKSIGNDNEAGDCIYKSLANGQTVDVLCGVNAESIQAYNSGLDFSKLPVGQPVCCSEGKAPDLRPKKNSDGSCYVYTVKSGDTCSAIFAKYSPLSELDLMKYNQQNFGWLGCTNLQKDYKLCLSDGTVPRPTVNPLAECRPQAPGDKYNTTCPLNACCSEFGFCGLTSEFCNNKPSLTGSPGTTGCLTNCGYGHLSSLAGTFKNIAYWLDADGPMASDPFNYDDGSYDAIHYAFVNINSDFSIDDSKFSNSKFLNSNLKNSSFGGWGFSTSPSTYQIIRKGVQIGNVVKFANNVVNFLNKYNLDGLDFDWEYPGAPDILGIPADDPKNGNNYLNFLILVKAMLPAGKTLSVALPASYWYLKAFPIYQMHNYVDYFIYMTYDIHGTWDLSKDNAVKCHTNKTEIVDALKMLNKAGLNLSKVRGGLANYGRSYKLANPSCYAVGCPFTGGGEKGPITNTDGILADSEIINIDASKSKNQRWTDSTSECIFMVYDTNNVVGWTANRNNLQNYYQQNGLRGSSLWLTNYFSHDTYNSTDYESDWSDEEDDDVTINYDPYNCKTSILTDLNNYDNINFYCKQEALINYTIYIAKNATNNIQNILNNYNTYEKNYNAYVTSIQNSIMSEYLDWYYDKPGSQYYSCQNANDMNACVVKTVGPQNTCRYVTMSGLYSLSDNINLAAASLSLYYNMTINTLIRVYQRCNCTSTLDGNGCEYNIKYNDCKAADLIQDPMANITMQNVTDIISLLTNAQNALGNQSPIDILDSLTAALIFTTAADNIMEINSKGSQVREIEKEEREKMIVAIVFGILGFASMFLGPIDGILAAIALDTVQMLADWSISGSINKGDIISLCADAVFGIISGLKLGESFASIANTFRALKNDDLESQLNKFERYREVREKLIGKTC